MLKRAKPLTREASGANRLTLPFSLGTSAAFHITLVSCALLFFKVSTAELRIETPSQPPQLATLALPPDFLKPTTPPAPPEPTPAPQAQAAPEVAKEEPKKKPRFVKRKKLTTKRKPIVKPDEKPPETPAKPSEVPIEHITKATPSPDADNTSPVSERLEQGDGEGKADGISKQGDPNGVLDPNAEAKDAPSAPAAPGVDLGALRRGYQRAFSRAVRRHHKYPMGARRARIEGVVKLKITVNAQGQIVDVQVMTSSGHGMLDDAAVASVRSLRQMPPLPPELGWQSKSYVVPFRYRLNDI